MQSCNLTVTISALACELAKGKTAEEALCSDDADKNTSDDAQ